MASFVPGSEGEFDALLADITRRMGAEGGYAEAIPIAAKTLKLGERLFGPDHPHVAGVLVRLGELLRKNGNYRDAEPSYKRALAIYEQALGPESTWVSWALHNLSLLYGDQGRFAESEPLLLRSMSIQENARGSDHPDYAHQLKSLAKLYFDQGRYAEAEPLLRRCLAIREKVLGPDDPDVADALNALGMFCNKQGRPDDALHYYKRALGIYEKTFGTDHRAASATLNNLAGVFMDQGRFIDAEPLCRRSLAIIERTLPDDHPLVAGMLGNIGFVCEAQGRYGEAEALYKRSLALREETLGPAHPSVALTLGNLAELYKAQMRYAESETLHKRSLDIFENSLGPQHLDVAASTNCLASLYRIQMRFSEAEALYIRNLSIDRGSSNRVQLLKGRSLEGLGRLYKAQGRLADAAVQLERALAIQENTAGYHHPDIGVTATNLAEVYRSIGRLEEADSLFRRALRMPKAEIGELAVLFGTNRQRDKNRTRVGFAGKRAEKLNLGYCLMVAGRQQTVRRAERRVDGAGLLERSNVELSAQERFAIRETVLADDFRAIQDAMGTPPKQALVFVHGYNVTFEEGLKRTAQIAFDLDFDGARLLFSWPSSARLFGYLSDRDSADIAADYFVEFIDSVGKLMPWTTLHLIAHSMGNIVVLSALEKMALRSAHHAMPTIGEVVLAHPDVDQDRLRQLAKKLKSLAGKMTLYTSQDDWALQVSRWLRGVGGAPIIVPGVDTIDFSGTGAKLFSNNHSVYATNPIVFNDISRLIASSERPPGLRTNQFEEVSSARGVYWRYGSGRALSPRARSPN